MWGPGKRWAVGAILVLLLPALALAADDNVKAKKKAEVQARRQAMLPAARACLCRVYFYFKQPAEKKPRTESSYYGESDWSSRQYDEFINRQMSLLTTGALLDDAGHVLIRDLHLDEDYIDRIEVLGPDGTRYPAVQDKLLERTFACTLRLTQPPHNWKPPAFVDQAEYDPDDKEAVSVARLSQHGREWRIVLMGENLNDSYLYEGTDDAQVEDVGGEGDRFMYTQFGSLSREESGPGLMCNSLGQPIGLSVSWNVGPRQKVIDWQYKRLLTGPAITFAELKDLAAKVDAKFGPRLCKCTITWRQEAADRERNDRSSIMSRRMSMMSGSSYGEGSEWKTFALAVSPKRLFVPQPIDAAQAAKIEKVEVAVADRTPEATFAGAYKEIGAFLIEMKDSALPDFAELSARERPRPGELFFTVAVDDELGKKRLRFRTNRWTSEARGYKDRYYVSPMFSIPAGTWLLNRNLDVIGVYAGQRLEGAEIEQATQGMMSMMRYGGQSNDERIFWTEELAPMVAEPAAALDQSIRHKSEEEAKRLPWLGVEFDPVTTELVKQLKVEEQCKNGSIGLCVNRVYKDSPAARLGIQVGDILLRLKTAKRPQPIDLAAGQSGSGWDFSWSQYVDYDVAEEMAEQKPRWPIRMNYLTMLLKTIGEGEKVELTYLHESAEVVKEFTIEQAPPDFLSAPKYVNKEVGLTVRDLTYEVQAGLQLPEGEKAVVVSKVEPGSPAAVARIAPFELITTIDGQRVGSAEEFGAGIKQALAAGKKTVRLTVELLGKTRLADLDLTQTKAGETPKPAPPTQE